jgi:hypothetical protein
MEELLKDFLKKAASSAVQAGIVSLATDADFKDAFKTIGGLNLAGAVLGGDSPLDIFKPKQTAARPAAQVPAAMQAPSGANPQDLIRNQFAALRGKDAPEAGSREATSRAIAKSMGIADMPAIRETALSEVTQPDTRGIMESLGDVISGDGGRGAALKQLFMPDPEGKPDPFRKLAPGLMGLIAAGYFGGAFDPVEQQQVQAYGGLTGADLLRQNPGGYRIGVPAVARGFAGGGDIDPSAFPRRTGGISGPGTGTSDDIPAMLSDGEFVMTAKAVRGAGDGNRENGIKNMYDMMRTFESRAA